MRKRDLAWQCPQELSEKNVLAFIREMGSVIFPELTDFFEHSIGTRTVVVENNHNLVAWTSLSKRLADILATLIKKNLIRCVPTLALRYTLYGKFLNSPVVRDTTREYKKERWYPMMITLKCPLED